MLKRKDLMLIAIVVLVALGGFAVTRMLEPRSVSTVQVTVDGRVVLSKPLAADGTYEIPQADGSLNVIEVKEGGVRMIEANCRDGVCISQGETRRAAKTIVCLPHKLVVQLVPDEQAEGPGAQEPDIVI